MIPPITLYGTMGCGHCQETKAYLEKRDIPFTFINVDALMGQERNDAMAVLNKAAMFPAFPTIIIGEKSVVGFDPEKIDAFLQEYTKTRA